MCHINLKKPALCFGVIRMDRLRYFMYVYVYVCIHNIVTEILGLPDEDT